MSLKEILKDAQGVPTGEYKKIAGGTMYADSPIGSILPYGGTTAPSGWMICNGASLLRTDYAELFAVIGTAFGSADSTHFNIPDLRGEFLRGAGTNSHSGQGSGGSVGQHQDGTPIVASYMGNSGGSIYNMAGGYSSNMSAKSDKWTGNSSTTYLHHPSATEAATYSDIIGKGITRPTNTSVNYIIKAKMVALPVDLDEAVDEKISPIEAVIPSDASTSNKLVTESVVRFYEYTSSNVPTKASFLNLLASSNAHMDFKFLNATTDYMPNTSPYWYAQKFGGTDALHIRLLATDWVSGDLYIGDANSTNNTITWWRFSGTQV